MTMAVDFNLQQVLVDMEGRIRDDLRCIDARLTTEIEQRRHEASMAQETADQCVIARTALDGRLRNVEEKISWLIAACGAGITALIGLLWWLLTGRTLLPR